MRVATGLLAAMVRAIARAVGIRSPTGVQVATRQT